MADKTVGAFNAEILLKDTGSTINGVSTYSQAVTIVSGAGSASTTPIYTQPVPTSDTTAAATSAQTSVAASNLVVKASAGNLYALNCCAGGTAGYVMVFNLTSTPADGAVTPRKVFTCAANTSVSVTFNPPLKFDTGITLVFSSTGPFTKTGSSSAFLSGDYV
jgi:hypothetical protein